MNSTPVARSSQRPTAGRPRSQPPTLPAYAEMVPFVVLLVELKEGVRLLGYLVDEAGRLLKTDGVAEGVRMGAPVRLRFYPQAGFSLPSWTITR